MPSTDLNISQGQSQIALCIFVAANRYYSFDDGYITWINDDKAVWTITAAGMGRDDRTEIGPRPIPQEPMVSE